MKPISPIPVITRSLVSLLALTLVGGCAHVQTGSIQQANLPAGQVLPHRAALVLDQELASYKYEFHRAGDTWVYPFGTPLQNYAEQVVKHCFQQVDVVPTTEKAAAISSAELILVPRAVKCEASLPFWGTQNVNMTFVVEWTAKDRANQNTIWLKTITANASDPLGSSFTLAKHQHALTQKLFDDLTVKTFKAFQEADELRNVSH